MAHQHPNKKKVVNRLSRIIGHMEAIKKMVEDDRNCNEVLIQISAVKSALNNTGKLILTDHLNHCVKEAVEDGDMEQLEAFEKALDQYIR
ncbi:metal-sensing transcriptional repressor [Vallitalea okinawensis]|uniref:metal-sensing transcriptional repressor n=1 Tax=Vallitalea okinawensis TaxID=2078660 RepID=UPI000CFCC5B7|nr:metal-sensing transcriptional repressor [Vallitalea okinawensis]